MVKKQENTKKQRAMKDEEGHFKERRTDYSKELQMFVKRGITMCQECPFNSPSCTGEQFEKLFHVECCKIDISTLEVHGL